MKKKPKEPDTLIFPVPNLTTTNSEEIDFYAQGQKMAIEQAKLEIQQEELEGLKQDREERKKYAKEIFAFIKWWCFSILFIMIFTGLGWFKFDNSVIITLLTTTTANILALFVIVANYLFFRNKTDPGMVKSDKNKKASKIAIEK